METPRPKWVHLRAWNMAMGAKPYYIDRIITIAEQDGAPDDAIYRTIHGNWRTFSEIVPEILRWEIAQMVREIEEKEVTN